MQIFAPQAEHVDALTALFDRYRQFCGKTSNLALSERFVRERLDAQDTHFFLARIADDQCQGRAAGFVHLFPSFSSASATRILLLNDLYVLPTLRKRGVGRALVRAAKEFACNAGYAGIKLETQETNRIGQALYESEGYVRLRGFHQYFFTTPARRGLKGQSHLY